MSTFAKLLFPILLIGCGSEVTLEGEESDVIVQRNLYTLFSDRYNTYLIDEEKELERSWESSNPIWKAKLVDKDIFLYYNNYSFSLLLRGVTASENPFYDTLELVDWEGKTIWSYSGIGDEVLYGDFIPLRNGNILIQVFERVSDFDLRNLGMEERRFELNGEILFPKIVEIRPNIIEGSTKIMWEWKLSEHMVQNEFPSLGNYSEDIALEEDKFDINFDINYSSDGWGGIEDISYNSDRNHIAFTMSGFKEIIILDKSSEEILLRQDLQVPPIYIKWIENSLSLLSRVDEVSLRFDILTPKYSEGKYLLNWNLYDIEIEETVIIEDVPQEATIYFDVLESGDFLITDSWKRDIYKISNGKRVWEYLHNSSISEASLYWNSYIGIK